jgi:hypothetical protein
MFKTSVLVVALVASSTPSVAATIDFEGILTTSGGFFETMATYEEDGFRLTNSLSYPDLFYSPNPGSPYYAGSRTLFPAWTPSTTTLRRIDGAAFSLTSIDLSEFLVSGCCVFEGTQLTFTAQRAAGGVSLQAQALDAVPGTQTVVFGNNFADVLSVSWENPAPYHQFDNIVVGAAAVPEVSTLLFAASGVLSLAIVIIKWR